MQKLQIKSGQGKFVNLSYKIFYVNAKISVDWTVASKGF